MNKQQYIQQAIYNGELMLEFVLKLPVSESFPISQISNHLKHDLCTLDAMLSDYRLSNPPVDYIKD